MRTAVTLSISMAEEAGMKNLICDNNELRNWVKSFFIFTQPFFFYPILRFLFLESFAFIIFRQKAEQQIEPESAAMNGLPQRLQRCARRVLP